MDPARARIREEAQRRGISRLCHFTRLAALPSILEAGGVLSRQAMTDCSVPHAVNDALRLDGHLDYVSCSIQYPNVFVLDRFAEGRPRDWMILDVAIELLWDPQTLFCGVNAAKFSGRNVGGGFEKFELMFAEHSSVKHYRRGPRHLLASPTDLQAEVLVFDAIRLEYIRAVVLVAEAAAASAVSTLKEHGADLAVFICPAMFDRMAVTHAVTSGQEILMSPWHGLKEGR